MGPRPGANMEKGRVWVNHVINFFEIELFVYNLDLVLNCHLRKPQIIWSINVFEHLSYISPVVDC